MLRITSHLSKSLVIAPSMRYLTRDFFRLKQRTLPWHFHIEHLPGKTNLAADVASRYPVLETDISIFTDSDKSEAYFISTICKETEEITPISWALLSEKNKQDPILSQLMTAI